MQSKEKSARRRGATGWTGKAAIAAGVLLGLLPAMLLADDAAPPPAAQATDGQPLKTFPVIGENDPAKAPPPDHPVEPLKEVVVTARRKDESAQDVPISLTVLDGNDLAKAGLMTPQDFQERVPGLVFTSANPRNSTYAIRGLGSISANDGIESSVGIFLDGVYLGRQGLSVFDLIDLAARRARCSARTPPPGRSTSSPTAPPRTSRPAPRAPTATTTCATSAAASPGRWPAASWPAASPATSPSATVPSPTSTTARTSTTRTSTACAASCCGPRCPT